jgi:hypothetical protein
MFKLKINPLVTDFLARFNCKVVTCLIPSQKTSKIQLCRRFEYQCTVCQDKLRLGIDDKKLHSENQTLHPAGSSLSSRLLQTVIWWLVRWNFHVVDILLSVTTLSMTEGNYLQSVEHQVPGITTKLLSFKPSQYWPQPQSSQRTFLTSVIWEISGNHFLWLISLYKIVNKKFNSQFWKYNTFVYYSSCIWVLVWPKPKCNWNSTQKLDFSKTVSWNFWFIFFLERWYVYEIIFRSLQMTDDKNLVSNF